MRRGIAPIIIIGGILSGVFTPTGMDAAAIACTRVLTIIYQCKAGIAPLGRILRSAAVRSAGVMLVIPCSALFGWLAIGERTPFMIARGSVVRHVCGVDFGRAETCRFVVDRGGLAGAAGVAAGQRGNREARYAEAKRQTHEPAVGARAIGLVDFTHAVVSISTRQPTP